MKLLFIDTETTGLENGRLIQLAFAQKENIHKPLLIFSSYYRPPEPISFEAMSVHHITNEMILDNIYFSESEEKKQLSEMQKDHIFIAHNAKFDLEVLAKEGLNFPLWIDTKRVAMHLIEAKNYKLQYLRYFLNLSVEGLAHDALGDVKVLGKLFDYLYRVAEQKLQTSDQETILNHMMTLSVSPVLIKELTFGKHKGKTFDEVFQMHRDYLAWLWNEEMKKVEDKRNQDMIFTLKQYLNHAQ